MPEAVALEHDVLITSFLARMQSLNRSPNTLINYRRHVRKLAETYASLPFEALTAEHIERHLYARPVGPRAQVAELSALKTFYEFLRKQKRLVKTNPCLDVEAPHYEEPIRPAPTFEEFEALYARCRTLEESVAVNLYFQTAVRLHEGLHLRVGHLNLARREIRVVKGKGGKDRIVVFDPRKLPEALHLTPRLREFIAGKRFEDYVFPSPRTPGLHRSNDWVQTMLKRLGREIGLPYELTTHLLRHGWTRWSAEVGLPIDMAQAQLGHASIDTTVRVYRRVSPVLLRRSVDDLMGPPDRT